jgi:hypothetical protein
MKYLLVLSLALILGSVAAADEIYVPDNLPTSGSTNVIPFDANFMKVDCRYQALYFAKYLGGKPFMIKKMSFAAAYTGNLKTTQMQIRISHFTGATLNATMDQNIPSPVTVLDAPHTFTYTKGIWNPVGLTSGFVYNGVDNIVVDIRYKSGSNTATGGFKYTSSAIPRNWAYGNYNATTRSGTDTTAGLKTRFTVDTITITASGKPSPGGAVTLNLAAPGDGGLPYQIGSSLGTGPIPIDTRQLGLSADAILVASVGGYLPTVFKDYAGTLDAAGKGKGTINIPNFPALVGVKLHSAFVTIDSKSPSSIKSISPTETIAITT